MYLFMWLEGVCLDYDEFCYEFFEGFEDDVLFIEIECVCKWRGVWCKLE